MKQTLAYFLSALLLLQSFGRELLVANYELNKGRITALYCVNKARPQLHCNGKCHLARQLRKADGGNQKVPLGSAAKVKFEVLPTSASFTFRAPGRWLLPAQAYASPPGARYADAPATSVFRPPLPQI